MNNFNKIILRYAEAFDAWRIVPRALVFVYGSMLISLITWYRGMETFQQKECDNVVLQTLIDSGVSPEMAMNMVCTVVDVVGGPTAEQTAFASAIIGLAAAIFGFYVNSGRKWDRDYVYRRGDNPQIDNQPTNNNPPMRFRKDEEESI